MVAGTPSQNLNIDLPTIIKDVVLMSPGTWNEAEYSAHEIQKAFQTTDWNDPTVTSLFLDHPENSNNAAGAWAGRVLNQRMTDNEVIGDLELWDTNTIIKLTMAKAKFGVSPRVIGNDASDGAFKNFVFDNFSIVSKPAIDRAYIELAKKQYNSKSQALYSKETKALDLNESNLTDMKGGKENMSDEVKEEKKEDKVEPQPSKSQESEAPAEAKAEEPAEAPVEEAPKDLNFEDLSADELKALIAKATKALDAKAATVKEMSAAVSSIISKEMEDLKKTVKELKAQLDKPAPKTTPTTGTSNKAPISAQLLPPTHTEGVQELAAMITKEFG